MSSKEDHLRAIVDALDSKLINAYGSLYVLQEGLKVLLEIVPADGGAALVLATERSPSVVDVYRGLAEEAYGELLALLRESLGTPRALAECPGLQPWRERYGYQGLHLQPFQTPEGIAGCVVLVAASALEVTEVQRRWFDRAVRKMGAALERTRLMEALQAKVLQWNLLMKVGREIVARPDEQLLSRTVSLVASTFGYEQVAFLSPQDDGWKVEALAGSAPRDWQVGETIAAPDGLLPEPADAKAWEATWDNRVHDASGRVFGEVAVPVTQGGEVLGILDVRSSEADPFAHKDPIVLKSVADQVAVALENQRLLLQIQERASYLQKVADISQQSVAIRRLRDLLLKVVEMTAQQLQYESVHIFLLDEGRTLASLAAAYRRGASEYYAKPTYHIRVQEEGLVGRAVRTGNLVLSGDVRQEPDFVPDPEFPAMSELVIPLRIAGRIIGVLDIASVHLDAFSQQDANILTTLGNVIAVAIENARLHEQERQTSAELAERNLSLLQAQARLVEAERLAAIGEITLAIKHEINNPMTAILGNAEWLLEEEQGLSDEGRRALTLVYKMALRVRDIVMRLENVEDKKRPYLESLEMTDLRDGKSA